MTACNERYPQKNHPPKKRVKVNQIKQNQSGNIPKKEVVVEIYDYQKKSVFIKRCSFAIPIPFRTL